MALVAADVVANELERVEPNVPTLFDHDAVFYADIEKRPVEVISSRDMRIPLELRPGGRSGAVNFDGGDLGRGSGPTFDKAVTNTVNMAHKVEWTKKAEWSTDSARKAVLNTFRHLLAKSMAEFRRNVDSWCMGDGTGVMGVISAVANAGGKDTYTFGTDGFAIRLLRDDHSYSIYNAALSTRRTFTGSSSDISGEALIEFHDISNKQVRMDGEAAGAVAGDKLVVSGLSSTPPVWLNGVAYHHSDASTGTWLGLDRATIPQIRANRVTASGSLAFAHARLAMNKIGDRVGRDNMKKVVAWMHPAQVAAFEALAQQVMVVNKTSKNDTFNPYFSEDFQLAGAPVKTSFSWDKTRIDFIARDAWGRAEMHPPGFYTVDGRKIFPLYGASGGLAAAQIFYIVASFNLFINNPAVGAYISGLTVPTGY